MIPLGIAINNVCIDEAAHPRPVKNKRREPNKTAANGQTVSLYLGRGGVSPPVYKQESMNGFSASHKSKNTNFVGEDIILPLLG